MKAAGQGVKEGVKNAVKNSVHGALRGRFLAPGTTSYTEFPQFHSTSMPPMAMMAPVIPRQEFPAYCACDVNPKAQKTRNAKRLYTCHSCAPRGMRVGDFRTQYNTNIGSFFGPRARPSPSYFSRLASPHSSMLNSNASRRANGSKPRGRSRSKNRGSKRNSSTKRAMSV